MRLDFLSLLHPPTLAILRAMLSFVAMTACSPAVANETEFTSERDSSANVASAKSGEKEVPGNAPHANSAATKPKGTGIQISAGGRNMPKDSAPCSAPNESDVQVPKDFSITYGWAPTDVRYPSDRRKLSLSANGQMIEQIPVGAEGANREVQISQQQVSAEEVRRVYAVVEACAFFDLKNSYFNKHFHGGITESLSVTAKEKTNFVSTHYWSVERFDRIVSVIKSVGVRP